MRRILILGAGGRDFHVFNTFFKNNPNYHVVAFAQVQIPGIGGKRYVKGAGQYYQPLGIPLIGLKDIEDLSKLIKEFNIDEVVLAFSDLLYQDVGKIISIILSSGASFKILGPKDTMLISVKPVIAVVATRTGAGKSTVSREVVKEIVSRGYKVSIVRHPMVYKEPDEMLVQIFKKCEELNELTFEEREEYEHYVCKMNIPVFAGVDYELVLREAEKYGDIILWDGGNNDFPFFKPNYVITVTDARRPGHEISSFPGEVNIRIANAIIITKVSDAGIENVNKVISNIKTINSKAHITLADLEVYVEEPSKISGKKVLIIEDAPTVTHGGLPYGAGYLVAKKYGAEIIDPKPYAIGIIKKIYEEYKHMGPVLPSLGYNEEQIKDLEETIKRIPADIVILGTPASIENVIKIDKPIVRAMWRLKILEGPTIKDLVDEFLEIVKLK